MNTNQNINNIIIPNNLIIEYYNSLIGQVYRLMPLYEGKDWKTKEIIYDNAEAFNMFHKYVQNLIVEICGSNKIFIVNIDSIKILSKIRGLQDINEDEHSLLKSNVMTCINLCKKIIKNLEENAESKNINNKCKECDIGGI